MSRVGDLTGCAVRSLVGLALLAAVTVPVPASLAAAPVPSPARAPVSATTPPVRSPSPSPTTRKPLPGPVPAPAAGPASGFPATPGPVPVPASGSTPASGSVDDAHSVYCLSSGHRPELIEAAVTLGHAAVSPRAGRLTVGGRDLDVGTWRWTHRAQFRSACAALIGSAGIGTGGAGKKEKDGDPWWIAPLTGLLGTLLGVVLTVGGTAWTARQQHRRELLVRLRDAEQALDRAWNAHRVAWSAASRTNAPPVEPLDGARGELLAALRTVAGQHPDWRWLTGLVDAFGSPSLFALLHERPPDRQAADTRLAALTEILAAAQQDVHQAFARLDRSRFTLRHRKVRTHDPSVLSRIPPAVTDPEPQPQES